MRQRFINWNAAVRDMRRHRDPVRLLTAETLQAIKDADQALGALGVGTADDLRRRLYELTKKLEARV